MHAQFTPTIGGFSAIHAAELRDELARVLLIAGEHVCLTERHEVLVPRQLPRDLHVGIVREVDHAQIGHVARLPAEAGLEVTEPVDRCSKSDRPGAEEVEDVVAEQIGTGDERGALLVAQDRSQPLGVPSRFEEEAPVGPTAHGLREGNPGGEGASHGCGRWPTVPAQRQTDAFALRPCALFEQTRHPRGPSRSAVRALLTTRLTTRARSERAARR